MTASATVVSEPVTGSGGTASRALASSGWLLLQWMRRDYLVRYRQSALGLGWAVLQPLLLLGIYGVVFVHALHVKIPGQPYVLFAYCGLTPWAFVSASVSLGVQSVLNAQPIVTKVWFPREIVPLAAVGVSLIDLAISTIILLGLAMGFGKGLHPSLIALLPIYAALIFLVAGLVVAFAALAVFLRDIRQAVPLVLQVVFIATPIMYSPSSTGGALHRLLTINPLATTAASMRRVVIFGQWPHLVPTGLSLAVGIVVFGVGLAYFRRVEHRFPDVM